MKKNEMLLVWIFQFLLINCSLGQIPTNGDFSTWNWENQDPENWKMTKEGITSKIPPPFRPVGPGDLNRRTMFINEIDIAHDYIRSKGWTLMGASFGPDNQHSFFALYNKYRSVIRLFYYIGNSISFTKGVATCTFEDAFPKPATLSSTVPFKFASDQYKGSQIGRNDIIVKVITDGIISNVWQATDFPMMFDPNLQDDNSTFRGAYIVFKLYGVDVEQIKLKGKGVSSSNPEGLSNNDFFFAGDEKEISKTSSAGGGTLVSPDFVLKVSKTKEFIGNLRKEIQIIKDDDFEPLKALKKNLQEAEFPDFLKKVSAITSAVGGYLSAANFIIGFMGGETTGPAIHYQVLELAGTIEVKQPLIAFSIRVPGVEKLETDSNKFLFECPMGLINLTKTPVIQITEPYSKLFISPSNSNLCVSIPAPILITGYAGRYIKLKLNEDIQMATNNVPGMHLLDVKFAILCKPKKDKKRNDFYKITDKYISQIYGFIKDHGQLTGQIENQVYNDLVNGRFIVHKYNPDDNPDEHEIYFGSPYLNKNCLRGITFEVPEETDVYLGVYALFNVNGMSEPVVFHAKYHFERDSLTQVEKKLLCNEEQPTFPLRAYYNFPTSIIILDKFTFGTYTTGTILLKPNFHASVKKFPFIPFAAKASHTNICIGDTTKIEPVFYRCLSQ